MSQGKPFKGRKCARKVSADFRQMENDLFNIFPSVGQINALRSNFSMSEIPGEERKFGPCDLEIKDRKVEPRDGVKGDIARAYLYMDQKYPGRGIVSSKNTSFLQAWSRMDPPDYKECQRHKAIGEIFEKRSNLKIFIAKNLFQVTYSHPKTKKDICLLRFHPNQILYSKHYFDGDFFLLTTITKLEIEKPANYVVSKEWHYKGKHVKTYLSDPEGDYTVYFLSDNTVTRERRGSGDLLKISYLINGRSFLKLLDVEGAKSNPSRTKRIIRGTTNKEDKMQYTFMFKNDKVIAKMTSINGIHVDSYTISEELDFWTRKTSLAMIVNAPTLIDSNLVPLSHIFGIAINGRPKVLRENSQLDLNLHNLFAGKDLEIGEFIKRNWEKLTFETVFNDQLTKGRLIYQKTGDKISQDPVEGLRFAVNGKLGYIHLSYFTKEQFWNHFYYTIPQMKPDGTMKVNFIAKQIEKFEEGKSSIKEEVLKLPNSDFFLHNFYLEENVNQSKFPYSKVISNEDASMWIIGGCKSSSTKSGITLSLYNRSTSSQRNDSPHETISNPHINSMLCKYNYVEEFLERLKNRKHRESLRYTKEPEEKNRDLSNM